MSLPRTIGLSAVLAMAALSGAAEAKMAPGLTMTGKASWYQHGAQTASGECFNPDGLTAAHRSLPLGSVIKVENVKTGKQVNLVVNDRGPFIHGRMLDVSRGGKNALGFGNAGIATVKITLVSLAQKAVRGSCSKVAKRHVRKKRNKS